MSMIEVSEFGEVVRYDSRRRTPLFVPALRDCEGRYQGGSYAQWWVGGENPVARPRGFSGRQVLSWRRSTTLSWQYKLSYEAGLATSFTYTVEITIEHSPIDRLLRQSVRLRRSNNDGRAEPMLTRVAACPHFVLGSGQFSLSQAGHIHVKDGEKKQSPLLLVREGGPINLETAEHRLIIDCQGGFKQFVVSCTPGEYLCISPTTSPGGQFHTLQPGEEIGGECIIIYSPR